MKDLYQIAGLSKQAHHAYQLRVAAKEDRTELYIQMIQQARVMHPVIGLAKIYYLFKPQGIGRDAFVNIGTLAGYALEAPKAKTTFKGSRSSSYLNLLADLLLTDVNQVWATDITYYQIGDQYYYISMIIDLYSRKIIACEVAQSLHALHSVKLLRIAIRRRKLPKEHSLIHHSDRGTQYTADEYIKVLKKHRIQISMCHSVFENTHMERINGIIKNSYLVHWNPKSFKQLKTLLKKAVNNYNDCPHGQLDMKSPNQFEQHLINVPLNQRTKMKVFTFKKTNTQDPNQLVLFNLNQLQVNKKGQHLLG